jgi:hypothetical protein
MSAKIWRSLMLQVFGFGDIARMQGKFPDVSGTAVGPKTSWGNLPCTPLKIPKTKNQYSFHGESLKSVFSVVLR